MYLLFLLTLIAFISGQITAFNFGGGVRILGLDFFVALLNLVALIFHYKKINWKQYVSIFGSFIGIAIISLLLQLFSLTPIQIGISSLYLFRFINYSLLTQTITFDKKIKEMSLKGLWISGVFIAALGLIQYFLYPNLRNLSYLGWDPHQYRVFSTFLDPNFTGIVLVLTLILGWYLYQYKITSKIQVTWTSVLVVLSFLLTYSRGSFISLLVIAIVWGMLAKKIKYVFTFGILFFLSLFLLPRIGGEGVNLLRTISIGARVENSQEAWQLFLKNPVFGVGFDTLRFIRDETEIVYGTQNVSHSGAGFHNSYLFVLATTGIVGFGAYLWMWWKLLIQILPVNKSLAFLRKLSFEVGSNMRNELFFFSIIAIGTHSFFDNSLFYPFVMYWVWVIFGSLSFDKSLASKGS